ncbi:MAG: hypothetical protein M3Y59_20790 [Myxococcota bacterium]|nr:hypothetical protein [Myxococcota bacterium]
MTPTNWTPGIVVLVVGLVAAGIYLLLTRKKAPATGAAVDQRGTDLELRAQLLIEELKELEQNRHQLDAGQLASEQNRLEREAADAFRARDQYRQTQSAPPRQRPAAPVPQRPVGTGLFARHPELKGALWGAGIVLFFGGLGVYLFKDEQARTEGGSMTGGPPPSMTMPVPSAEASTEEKSFQDALAQVKRNPDDLELTAAVVHELLRRQEWDDATQLNHKVLSRDPFHTESRIHQSVLHAAKGDAPRAIEELRHLALVYPDAQEALLFAGAIALERNEKASALASFHQYTLEADPRDVPAQLITTVQQLRAEVGTP